MKYVFLVISVFFTQIIQAQMVSVSGYVSEKNTGEKLIGVGVYDTLTHTGIYTNNAGFYSLSFPKGQQVRLQVESLGFISQSTSFLLKNDTILNFLLLGAATDSVIICASNSSGVGKTQMGLVEIPIEQMKKMPALLGEVDVLKIFQLMPGIKGGAEGSAGMYVRGGSPDQNLILLDDVPLYYVSHLGGFVSLFDANALGSIKLYKGGFPARYSGRLSSVIDLRIKEGNSENWKINYGLGILSSRFTTEGPLKKGKTSLLISTRLSTAGSVSYLLSKIALGGNLTASYNFYDIYAKVSHKISDKDKIYISFYNGKDKVRFSQRTKSISNSGTTTTTEANGGLSWGNNLIAFKWTHLYYPKLFHNITASYTHFNYNVFANVKEVSNNSQGEKEIRKFNFDFNSGIKDINLKSDFDYYPTNSHQIKMGTSTILHFFSPGLSTYISQNDSTPTSEKTGNKSIIALENNIYVEDDMKINERWLANIGFNFATYSVKDKIYPSFQPRLSSCYNFTDRFSMKVSYVYMQQHLHLLSRSTIGFPSDLWVPATRLIPPQKAHQFSLGSVYWLKKQNIEFSTELYYKQLKDLITYKSGSNIIANQNWEQIVEINGRGWAYGMEMMLQKKSGKTTGWIGYALAYNMRQFQQYNQGKIYPFTYDRRHDISVVVSHHFNEKFSLSADWVYTSGRAATLAQALFQAINIDYSTNGIPSNIPGSINANLGQYYGSSNSFRMPAYHRLDISFSFHKTKKKGYREWNMGFYNVYNRQNPFLYYYDKNYQTQEVKMYQYTLFPILPFLSYVRSF